MSAAESDVRGNAAAGIRRNNFDLIRLAAAAQVMLVHLSEHFPYLGMKSSTCCVSSRVCRSSS